MTLIILSQCSEGIAIVADKRSFYSSPNPSNTINNSQYKDDETKIYCIEGFGHIGFAVSGRASFGAGENERDIHVLLPEVKTFIDEKSEQHLSKSKDKRLPVIVFTKLLAEFFEQQWRRFPLFGAGWHPSQFLVAGYDETNIESQVFYFQCPPHPQPKQIKDRIYWMGDTGYVYRVVKGYDLQLRDHVPNQLPEVNLELPLRYESMKLVDYLQLSVLLIEFTIKIKEFTNEVKSVGGGIDIALITRGNGFDFLRMP